MELPLRLEVMEGVEDPLPPLPPPLPRALALPLLLRGAEAQEEGERVGRRGVRVPPPPTPPTLPVDLVGEKETEEVRVVVGDREGQMEGEGVGDGVRVWKEERLRRGEEEEETLG